MVRARVSSGYSLDASSLLQHRYLAALCHKWRSCICDMASQNAPSGLYLRARALSARAVSRYTEGRGVRAQGARARGRRGAHALQPTQYRDGAALATTQRPRPPSALPRDGRSSCGAQAPRLLGRLLGRVVERLLRDESQAAVLALDGCGVPAGQSAEGGADSSARALAAARADALADALAEALAPARATVQRSGRARAEGEHVVGGLQQKILANLPHSTQQDTRAWPSGRVRGGRAGVQSGIRGSFVTLG